jgi:ubiquinone/menaquinone biosynthesis C-methylase UbiE
LTKFQIKKNEWHEQALSSMDPKIQVGRPFTAVEWKELADDIKSKLMINDKLESILDVGCGNGLLLSKLKGHFLNFYGIDYAQAMIDQAKALMPGGKFTISQADNIGFEDNMFARVLCVSIFHYFPNYKYSESVILELIRVCKTGGVILIGDLLDKNFEQTIRNSSTLDAEKKLPSIHRYSEWLFYDLEELSKWISGYASSVQILEQPALLQLSKYRKDLRIIL